MLREEINQRLEEICEQTGQPMHVVLYHIVERYFYFVGRVIDSKQIRHIALPYTGTDIDQENFCFELTFGEALRKKMHELGLREVTCQEA